MIINYQSESRLLGSFQQTNNVVRATRLVIAVGRPPFELVLESILVTKLTLVSTLTKELKF